MFTHFSRGTSAAIILISSAGIASADVTAQQVWDDFRAYIAATGYEVAATERMSGDTLTVSDLSLSMELPEGDGQLTMQMGELRFTETGDGAVNVSLPASMPITLSGTDSDGEMFNAEIDYTQSGFTMVVSGNPDDMSYTYSAAQMGMELRSITGGGQTMAPEDARMVIAMTNITGMTQMQKSDLRVYDQRGSAGSLTYDMAFVAPEDDGRFSMQGGSNNITFSGNASLPEDMDIENLNAMLNAGFSASGTIMSDGGNTNIDFSAEGEEFAMQSSSQGGTVVVGLDTEKLLYTVNQRGVDMNILSGELPFPIAASLAELGMNILIPTQAGEGDQDFAFNLTLADFTMSDLLWGIFDPAGQLPRDPATIAMDLSGQVKVLVNYLDPEVAETLEQTDATPVELNAMTLNDLRVSAAGAALTGTGSFTFDNTDVETFDGMPAPNGSVDLKLVGGNGLLDRLVSMGLLPEEQAMGARMMMGLFAVPGDQPDTLTSKIEVSPDGQIKANGQRIQ